MGPPRSPPKENESFTQLVSGLSHSLSELIQFHFRLARRELMGDLHTFSRDWAIGALGVPVFLCGYLLLWVALALYAGTLGLPLPASFALAALVNLFGGALILVHALRRSRRDKPDLAVSRTELKRDKDWLSTLKEHPEEGVDSGEPK